MRQVSAYLAAHSDSIDILDIRPSDKSILRFLPFTTIKKVTYIGYIQKDELCI